MHDSRVVRPVLEAWEGRIRIPNDLELTLGLAEVTSPDIPRDDNLQTLLQDPIPCFPCPQIAGPMPQRCRVFIVGLNQAKWRSRRRRDGIAASHIHAIVG